MNSFGKNFRVSIFGESHGTAVGVTIDGIPAGTPISEVDFTPELIRRKGTTITGATSRSESDQPRIIAGAYKKHTNGAPLTILFDNQDKISAHYLNTELHPRPSHADLVAYQKHNGYNDPRGGGHFSGRLTVALTAAGVVARKLLPESVNIKASVIEVGGQRTDFDRVVKDAAKNGDSLGGIVECRVTGLRAGIGEPFFDSIESVLSHLLFSIPAVKGVEFGAGFNAAKMMGSNFNDAIIHPTGKTSTNNDGGAVGGLTNSNELVIRVAIKPTPSIAKPQTTIKFDDQTHKSYNLQELSIVGRHDTCIALRAPAVVEAAVAIGLADLTNY